MGTTKMPRRSDLIQPVLSAIHELGGIAGTFMIDERVFENLKFSKELIQQPRSATDARSEASYQLAWVRTYLKNYGLIENPQRGLWQLTPQGARVKTVDYKDIRRHMRQLSTTKSQT